VTLARGNLKKNYPKLKLWTPTLTLESKALALNLMEKLLMKNEAKLVRFDWAIKYLLRDKANFDILEGFLSALLNEKIQIISILESESNQFDSEDKFNRVDILVKDQKQRQIIIEVQNHHTPDYLERLLFGVCKVIVDNFELGDDYRKITKVIVVGILYFNFGDADDYVYYSTNDLYGIHTNSRFSFFRKGDDKKYHRMWCKDIYPEYYLIHVERFEDAIGSDLDEWIYMLKHSVVPANCQAKNLEKAKDKLALMKMDREQRQRYERYLMNMTDERGIINAAQNEGERRGREKGLQEAKLEIAKNLQQSGMDIDSIATMTGLSLEAIKSLSD
jgi:hypothetical protein